VLQIKITQNYQLKKEKKKGKKKTVIANTNTLSSNCKVSVNSMAKKG
jgi:hypothetical protein